MAALVCLGAVSIITVYVRPECVPQDSMFHETRSHLLVFWPSMWSTLITPPRVLAEHVPQVDQHGVNKAVSPNEEAELAVFQGRTKWPVVFSVFFSASLNS